jgi:acetyl-CoA carboxylase, biotin carboxylase subunit
VAKLIVWAADRGHALALGRAALQELRIEGIKTTIPFHLRMLDDPGFRAGTYHTEYLDQTSPV